MTVERLENANYDFGGGVCVNVVSVTFNAVSPIGVNNVSFAVYRQKKLATNKRMIIKNDVPRRL